MKWRLRDPWNGKDHAFGRAMSNGVVWRARLAIPERDRDAGRGGG